MQFFGQLEGAVAVITISLSVIFLRMVLVGQSTSRTLVIESTLKLTGVASGPVPTRPITLLFGRVWYSPILVMLWYIVNLLEVGAFAKMSLCLG